MTRRDKLIQKVFNKGHISSADAELILESLGFTATQAGTSHRVYRKEGYPKVISLKTRSQLLDYQLHMIREALEAHGEQKA